MNWVGKRIPSNIVLTRHEDYIWKIASGVGWVLGFFAGLASGIAVGRLIGS